MGSVKAIRSGLVVLFSGFLAMFVAVQQASASPFTNGDFETPAFTGAAFKPLNFPYQGVSPVTIPGWQATTDGIANGENFVISSLFQPVPDGNQALLFNGDGAAATTLFQTFDTLPGISYSVSFELTAQQLGINGSGNTFTNADLVAQASGLGNVPQSYLATGTPGGSGLFPILEYQYLFTAQSNLTTLTFSQSDGGTTSPILDDVQVQALPEPAAIGMLALGSAMAMIRPRFKRATRFLGNFGM